MLTLSRMKLTGIKRISNDGMTIPWSVIREIVLSVGIDIPSDEKIDEERISRIANIIERAEPTLISREFWINEVVGGCCFLRQQRREVQEERA